MGGKVIRNYFKSMKFRLLFLFLVLGILSGITVRIGVLTAYEERVIDNRSIEVLSQSKILATQIVSTDYIHNLSSETITSQLQRLSQIYDGRVMLIDDTFRIVKDTYDLDENRTIISEEVVRCLRGEEISRYDKKNRYIEMTIPLIRRNLDTNESLVIGALLVSVSTDAIASNLDYMRQRALVIQLIAGMVLFALGIFLSIHLTNPLKKIADSIDEIQMGKDTNDGKLMVTDSYETARISDRFNRLFGRMKLLDDSRQEFVSNVSHELKTPLTSMKVLADSLNGQEDVPVELYREFMADIGNEIERENKIINDLLSLVRMDKASADLNITSVSINELLDLILKRLKPIAEKKHVDLVLESFRPVTAEVDEVKLTLAISNLVENAIKYNREGGWVHVSLNADYQYFYLKVEDSGIGIPEDSLDHIYERFYRVDKSHSREIGGTGLGLAITRSCILMHRGAIKVFSTEGEGTLFTVRIPLNYIS